MFDELVPAAVYTRVSTDEQVENGYSLAGQLELCRKYAAQYGMTIVQEFVDRGVSGDLPLDARPQGKALLELIRTKQISAVIIATQDRLSRNLAHTLVIRQQWQTQGIEVHFCDRGKVQNTPEGRLMSNVEAIIAAGKVIASGAPAELIVSRLAPETVEFDFTPNEEALLFDGFEPKRRLRIGRRLMLYVDDAAHLIERIRGHDKGDRRPVIVRPTNLEDVFLSLTGTSLEGNP